MGPEIFIQGTVCGLLLIAKYSGK